MSASPLTLQTSGGLCLFLLSHYIKIYPIAHLWVFSFICISIMCMQCPMEARRGRQIPLEL